MVRLLKEKFKTIKINDPQVETFGISEAEERFCLDMKMCVGEHTHNLKIKVYNTAKLAH